MNSITFILGKTDIKREVVRHVVMALGGILGSYYKQQLNDFVAQQRVSAKVVFDIGGAQHPIKGRTASWEVEDYKIVDLEIPHVELQRPDIVHDMNHELIRQLNHPLSQYKDKVDLIYCLGVFDYVINPNIAMETIKKLLAPDGIAWIEFPFVYPIHNPVEEEGCRYSEGCIRRLAKQAGLNIEEIIYKRPKPDNPYLQLFYQADGMRAARGVDHNVIGYICKLKK